MENNEDPLLELDQEDLVVFGIIDPHVTLLAKNLYKDTKDKAHDWNHILDVGRACIRINEYFGTPLEPLLLAALFHDMYSESDRKNHHTRAAKVVPAILLPTVHHDWGDEVAKCCEQHRASFTGEYYSEIQEAFASADRGMLHMNSIHDVVKRSYAFTVGKGYEHKEAVARTCEHMHDKYSNTGYAKWPEMYQELFSAELTALKQAATEMTEDKVELILST